MDGDWCLVLLMSSWLYPVFLTVSLFCKFILSERKKKQLCNPLIFQVLLMFWFWGMASSNFESQRFPWLRRDLTDGMSSVFHCLDRSCSCGGHVWLLIGGLCGHFVAFDRTSVQRRYSWNLLWPLQHVHGCCSSSCQPPRSVSSVVVSFYSAQPFQGISVIPGLPPPTSYSLHPSSLSSSSSRSLGRFFSDDSWVLLTQDI